MSNLTNRPKGTADIFGTNTANWHYIEDKIRSIAKTFGLNELRTPMFEYAELFSSVGEDTDIVQKEMYTFTDKGERTYALKPEGTAAAVRAYIENGLSSGLMPSKIYYITPCFRAERPQKGRLRQHHQFGVEFFGSYAPQADVELISLVYMFLSGLGIQNMQLNLNSLGGAGCREDYNKALTKFLTKHKDSLCPLCTSRMEKNPMRVLDCKNEDCKQMLKDAPVPINYLDDDSLGHFEEVKKGLSALGIPFEIDNRIVRGLDYYNRTVFEILSGDLGSQSSICGGGRYDGLIARHGGTAAGAVGFGLGLERLLLVLEAQKLLPDLTKRPALFLANATFDAMEICTIISYNMRKNGISAAYDTLGRSLKAQLKYADRLGAEYVVVVGEEEINSGRAMVRNMDAGHVFPMGLGELMSGMWKI